MMTPNFYLVLVYLNMAMVTGLVALNCAMGYRIFRQLLRNRSTPAMHYLYLFLVDGGMTLGYLYYMHCMTFDNLAR